MRGCPPLSTHHKSTSPWPSLPRGCFLGNRNSAFPWSSHLLAAIEKRAGDFVSSFLSLLVCPSCCVESVVVILREIVQSSILRDRKTEETLFVSSTILSCPTHSCMFLIFFCSVLFSRSSSFYFLLSSRIFAELSSRIFIPHVLCLSSDFLVSISFSQGSLSLTVHASSSCLSLRDL